MRLLAHWETNTVMKLCVMFYLNLGNHTSCCINAPISREIWRHGPSSCWWESNKHVILFVFHIELGFTSNMLMNTENQQWKKQQIKSLWFTTTEDKNEYTTEQVIINNRIIILQFGSIVPTYDVSDNIWMQQSCMLQAGMSRWMTLSLKRHTVKVLFYRVEEDNTTTPR